MTMQVATNPKPAIPAGFTRDLDLGADEIQSPILPVLRVMRDAPILMFGDEQMRDGMGVLPLGTARRRIYWANNAEKARYGEDAKRPLCKSDDGLTGAGLLVTNEIATGDCQTCPMAEWDDATKTPPPCSAQRVLVVQIADGRIGEIVFAGMILRDFDGVARHIRQVGWDNAAFHVRSKPMSNKAGTRKWYAVDLAPTVIQQPQAAEVVIESVAREVSPTLRRDSVRHYAGDARVYSGDADISNPPPMPPTLPEDDVDWELPF